MIRIRPAGGVAPLARTPPAPLGARRRYPLEGLIARLLAPTLDRRLAAGEDPCTHPLLIARAAKLAGRSARLATAAGWERAIRDVGSGSGGLHMSVPVCAAQVADALDVLLTVIARLRDDEPAWPAGGARARMLLADGAGPLYDVRAPAGELRRRARLALAELNRGPGLNPFAGEQSR